MQVDRLRRKPLRGVVVLWTAVLAFAFCSAIALASSGSTPSLAGNWSGSYSGPIGGSFTFHWTQTGSSLTGKITISNPKGTYDLNGTVNGTAISFGAVGAGAVYSGSVAASGLSMSGNWESGPIKGTWSAHKVLTPTRTKVKVKVKVKKS